MEYSIKYSTTSKGPFKILLTSKYYVSIMRSAPTLSSFECRLITLLVATAVYQIKFETIHSYFALHFILPFDFIQFWL